MTLLVGCGGGGSSSDDAPTSSGSGSYTTLHHGDDDALYDGTKPIILSHWPHDGQVNVSTNTKFEFTFNRPILLEELKIAIEFGQGDFIDLPGEWTWNSLSNTAIFSPQHYYGAVSTQYWIKLEGVTDRAGNVNLSPLVFQFTTASVEAEVAALPPESSDTTSGSQTESEPQTSQDNTATGDGATVGGSEVQEETYPEIITNFEKGVYYISPDGNDTNDGLSSTTPWKTFAYAFSAASGFSGGDELVLLPGSYSISQKTGILRSVDDYGNDLSYSSAIPSGLNRSNPTIVRAAILGSVKVYGASAVAPISIGRNTSKSRFIKVQGITFIGGGALHNADYVVVKECGFNGGFDIGTNSHEQGNRYNLVEDVWIWANNRRVVASNYRSNKNVWRRVVIRGEGCDLPGCESYPKQDPSVGITVYESSDVSLQNVVVVDRLIRSDKKYADFATAQHSSDSRYFLGRNEWLGVLSINSQDDALLFEADNVVTTGDLVWQVKDFATAGSPNAGINIGNKPYNYDAAGKPGGLVENATVVLNNPASEISGIRVSPGLENFVIRNSLTIGATRAGYNARASRVENSLSYDPLSTEGSFDVAECVNCVELQSNPLNNGSVLSPLRVTEGSEVASTKAGVGGNLVNRYGRDGAIYGDEGYNAKTNQALWPWANEDIIKKQMCSDSNISRGFCTSSSRLTDGVETSLSSYIWEILGNPMPTNF